VPGGLYRNAPHLMLFPGSLLVVTVLAFNLLGDSLRDALDPRGGGI
jgi:ABC-type dipeptide/oligopeptide/nickel transport system permease subunit